MLRFQGNQIRRLAGEGEYMKGRISWLCLAVALLGCALFARGAFASAALFLEQPYGSFGFFNPTGHAAIYLSDVCAASPIHLRRCHAGEYGVVISRYHHVAERDWLAIPVIPYLYAVDDLSQIPVAANRETEAALRDAWRRKHLEALVPDMADGSAPAGEWNQLVGSLYDRKIYVYEVDTTAKQDNALIAKLNRQRNRSHFNLFFNNCADFARGILDFYYPHAAHRSFTADLGMTTPKQVAKSLAHYGNRHERTDLTVFVLPQVPGSIPRSSNVDGVLEAVIRKKYVAPLVWVQPYVAAGIVVTYLTRGRFRPGSGAVHLEPANVVPALWLAHASDANGPRHEGLSPLTPRLASLIPAPAAPALNPAVPAPLAAAVHAPPLSTVRESHSAVGDLSAVPTIPSLDLLAIPAAGSSVGESNGEGFSAAEMPILP